MPSSSAQSELSDRGAECLNAHLFESIAELRAVTGQWLEIYNRERPHDTVRRVRCRTRRTLRDP
jgi:transposase InsO family protein